MKQPIFKGSKPEKNPTNYVNDGFGRDSYISYNNGGNFGTEYRFLVTPKERTGMIMLPSPSQRSGIVPQRLFYQSDGSGRDTYVIQNVQEKIQTNVNYKQQLRSSTNFFLPPKVRYELPPLSREKMKRLYHSQARLTLRLSLPKKKSIEAIG